MSLRIGIDLGGTKIEGIVLEGSREVVRQRVPTPRGDYRGTLEAVRRLVLDLERQAGGAGTVGLGIPGAIDQDTHLVKNANSVWLIGRPLRTDLEALLDRPVRIANDANCFAISEAADGAAAGAAVVFGVIVGTGTGAGIVVHGQPMHGANGVAGEWGHNPLPWPSDEELPGPACYCGKRGCIETFLSGPALMRDFAAAAGEQADGPAIVARAAEGDAVAEGALVRYEQRMARALASVINILDPDVIVLGGGLSNIERLYARVPRIWAEWVFGAVAAPAPQPSPEPVRAVVRTQLRRARHGDASGVRGAAWLWPAG